MIDIIFQHIGTLSQGSADKHDLAPFAFIFALGMKHNFDFIPNFEV
jgi:hypothetical protein